jgi:hypothetical protein
MSRIITLDGLIPQGPDKPARPPTLEERLNSALEHWQFKRKDQAFATALNAIAYLSAGLAGMAKLTEQMRIENEDIKKRITTLEGRQP